MSWYARAQLEDDILGDAVREVISPPQPPRGTGEEEGMEAQACQAWLDFKAENPHQFIGVDLTDEKKFLMAEEFALGWLKGYDRNMGPDEMEDEAHELAFLLVDAYPQQQE